MLMVGCCCDAVDGSVAIACHEFLFFGTACNLLVEANKNRFEIL